jgi:hypothetical protein
MARKDKKKVVGEPMTDEQVRAFLHCEAEQGLELGHHMLMRAYRSLRSEDFSRFLDLFVAAGHNINATDTEGRTALAIIQGHQQGEEYAEALKSHMAS